MGMMGVGLDNGLGRAVSTMTQAGPGQGFGQKVSAMATSKAAPPTKPMPPMPLNTVNPLGSPMMTAVAGTATRALNPMTFMATGAGGMMQMHPEIQRYMQMFRRVPSWKLGMLGSGSEW